MSRRIIFALAWGFAVLSSTAAAQLPAVVPNPASMMRGTGEFSVTAATRVVTPREDAGARRAAANFTALLAKSGGPRLEVADDAKGEGAIRFSRVAELPGGPEAYRVEVKPKSVVVTAATDAGFGNAAATLWQLIDPRAGPLPEGAVSIPAVMIDDAPRFAWRGLMLDSARHFQSPEFIRRLVDWMALHKLNVLHWHLTDDQAWRLEIRKYPRLTEVGAWRVPAGAGAQADIDSATGKPRLYGGYYSQETVRSIVAYAAARGITIVPEIEMPGHATAAIVAYPRLGATDHPPTVVPSDWGIYTNVYSLEDSTFAFLEDVLDEVMALFPGPYIHVGGDEVEREQWRESPRARQRLAELGIDDSKAQAYFTQRIGRFLQSRGRRMVGWDEILEPGLSMGAVVMSWRGIEGAVAAANKGHDTVLAAHPTLYFDNRQSASPQEPPGRGRVVSLKDVYAFEPLPPAINAEAARHVLGVQANLWTEHIRTEERVAWMAFPRAAAVAELGWSQPDRRGWDDFQRRLASLQSRYKSVGLVAARPFVDRAPTNFRVSQQMRLCSEDIALSLEDDAPVAGKRAVFLLDVQNPCWIYPQAALDRARALVATVGQVPFNFQIGEAVKKIRFPQPTTPEGELEVRLDSCEGELLARLPLAPAVGNDGVTTLPRAPIAARPGRHDLCLRFAQPKLDPMWAIDSLKIEGAP
jgi:hexosaminidase